MSEPFDIERGNNWSMGGPLRVGFGEALLELTPSELGGRDIGEVVLYACVIRFGA